MALFLLPLADDAPDPPALAAARAELGRAGFACPAPLALPGWRGFHAGYLASDLPTRWQHGATLVAVAGTITVDRLMGEAALRRLPDAVTPTAGPDRARVGGQFAALLVQRGRAFLFGDAFGAFPLYRDEAGRTSTSLLALLAARPRVRWHAQGLYEYAFNIAPTGDDTVFEDIRTLGPDAMVELMPDGTARRQPLHRLRFDPPRVTPLPERIDRHRAVLERVIGTHVAAFGDRVRAPLSGGIDARLLLAALRAAGCAPSLYVYGPPTSADVTVAQAIAAAEGFAVAAVDKRAAAIDPDAFPALVAAEFHGLDALPNYGNIFDNGGNAAAMAARHAGGALAASGGCGEVYRDFFYLPDRRTSAAAVARAFFGRVCPGDATAAFDPRGFHDAIAAKLAAALGVDPAERLPRVAIEPLYPMVRCRALFGREIGVEARHGPYLMPFLDAGVVAQAMTLPMALKRCGRFEAALLHAIDPALARHPSTYGHHFAGPPSLARRWQEASSRHRPLWLRQRSYAIRRRLGPVADDHGGLIDHAYLSRVIDPGLPAMRRFFRPERIGDAGLLRRVAALEYLAAHLGSKLAG